MTPNKPLSVKTCRGCDISFNGYRTTSYCSAECSKSVKNKKKVQQSHIKFHSENSSEWVECKLCDFRSADLGTHYKILHKLESNHGYETKSHNIRESLTGNKNPAFNHGGKFSPWSKKFVKYSDDRVCSESISNMILKRNKTWEENKSLP
jgi:hypothetical protein